MRPADGIGMETGRALERLRVLESTLWQERNLLHYLHFKLVVANLVLAADAADFVTLAVQEVDQVMRRVREAEQFRASVVREAAAELGVDPGDLTLEYLATASPDEVRHLFDDHRAAFLQVVGDIEQVTIENRRLATVNLDAIRGTLGIVGGAAAGGSLYDAGGRPDTGVVDPALLDRAL